MLASLSSFYDNIRSYSRSGRKAGDKRRRERDDDDVIITDVLQTPPAKRLRNIEGAACARTSNTPIQSFTDFIRRVKNWSGRYFWNYVVQGETDDDNPSSLSRDLGDAEEEMEKFHSSTNTRLASVMLLERGLNIHVTWQHCAVVELKGSDFTLYVISSICKQSTSSKYRDIPQSKSHKPSQSKREWPLASKNSQGSPQTSRPPSRARGQTRPTTGKKSPGDRSRFISTAERVVRLDERDRYKQLVAQFTTLQTPDHTEQLWNTTCEHPLEVQTDFLTKTRSHARSGDGSVLSPRSRLLPPPVSFTVPASPPQSPTRLRVVASPRKTANRSHKPTPDVSLYSRPGARDTSTPHSNLRSRTLDKSTVHSPFDEAWTQKWRDVLSDDNLSRQREISREERKLKAIKQKRDEETQALKDRIQQRLKKGWDFEDEEEAEEEAEEITESFVVLTPDMDRKVDAALAPGYPDDPLVEGFRVTLKRSDIATLGNLNWLNDEVINFYFNLLVERSNQQGKVKVHAFNSFFYPKLIKSGYASLRRWTKKVDIFAMDLVLVPVHLGMHWCLAAVDFRKKCISYYDSLKGSNNQCLSVLRSYLNDESVDKKKVPFDLNGWKTASPKDIPEQLNGCDCGVFACKYAEYLSRRANFDFDQRHMPYFRRRMVYEILTKQLL
ncbi:unnamed protein product [Porites evermanni]|uniref:Ubiquitin-like protease family profile domain-containing protein n=1 Tax=Porites evermanni TaxID=104178 RepID=A0ABN8MML1_9CNID|nr:unnamed protein product [Porites evermanni]